MNVVVEVRLEREQKRHRSGRAKIRGVDREVRLFKDFSSGGGTKALAGLDLPAETVELLGSESALLSAEEDPAFAFIQDETERRVLHQTPVRSTGAGDDTGRPERGHGRAPPRLRRAAAKIESTNATVGRETVTRTLIAGGVVVTGGGMTTADVLVEDGSIARIGPDLDRSADRVVDAEGHLVLPGAIDVHVHPVYLDDLRDCSIAAAHGGMTTLIHYAYAKPGHGLLETVRRFREEGEGGSILDFALHGGIFDAANQADEVPAAIAEGVTSFKMFMTYAKLGWMTDDYQLMRVLDILGRAGGMGMVHAENGLATDYLQDKFASEGRDPVDAFVDTRPAVLEAEAVGRAIAMAQVASCPIYIPHVSAGLALDAIVAARTRGARVLAETCPQYLTLTDADLRRQGPLLKIGPPLRTDADRAALWTGVADGSIDTVASDHAPKAKAPGDDFDAAPYGSPQLETMLPLLLHATLGDERLTLPRLTQVLSETPARIFGLYPRKGTIAAGSDADLVVVDPAAAWTIERRASHSNATYSPYEGRTVTGRPILTMRRGEILAERGELTGSPGRGRFLRTETAGSETRTRKGNE